MILFTGGGGPASVHAGIPHPTPPEQSILGDTVNERAVCIVLECKLHKKSQPTHADLLQLNKILLQATRFKNHVAFSATHKFWLDYKNLIDYIGQGEPRYTFLYFLVLTFF